MSGSRAVGGSRRWAFSAVTIALILIASIATTAAQIDTVRAVNPVTGKMVEAVDGQILVVPRPGVTAQQIRDLCHQMNAVSGTPFFNGALWSIKLPDGQSVSAAVARYGASGLVRSAEPTPLYHFMGDPTPMGGLNAVPNDPRWSELWGLEKIDCPDAWDSEKGDPSVIIAIIDSGVDYNHPDLAAHMWTNLAETAGDGIDNDGNGLIDDVYGWDWHDSDNDPEPTDAAGYHEDHGTHVAGTASAVTDNAIGVAGVAWNAQIMALRVGSAAGIISTNVYAAMQYAADMGADVINLSLGGGYTPAEQVPVDYAYAAGITICAALGNSNNEITTDQATWLSPVCNDGQLGVDNKIIGVAATDENDTKASFGGPFGSNYSGAYWFCDVSAPGINILSTVWPGNGYDTKQGTSMACPHVAGLAALVISQIGKNDPAAVIDQIRTTTTNIDPLNPLYAGKLGTGRISAAAAVGLDLPPEPATAVNAFDSPGDEGGSVTITWRKSRDDGAGRNDVIGYELWRGQVPDPSGGGYFRLATVTDLPAGSSGYKDEDPTLVDGANYYYFVRTRDAANFVDSNVAGPASPRDDSAPDAVDTLVARDTQADEGRSITLTWIGYTGPADLTAFRVYRATTDFTDITDDGVVPITSVTNPAARNYVDQAADPDDPDSEPKDLTDYWYAVTAIDEANNEITAVTAVGPVQSAPNLSITFSLGLQMITIPAAPVENDPMSVFGLTDPTEMEFARYDPLTQSYRTLQAAPADPALEIVPGRGFWLDRPIPSLISVAGHVVEDIESVVPLDQGWNIIGSPYDAAYPFVEIDVRDALGTDEDITASNQVRKYAWRYDAFERSYKLISPLMPNGQDTLPARESMWVYAFVPGIGLVFDNNVAVTAAGAQVADKPALDGWQFRLVARTADAADTDNIAGVSAGAKALGTILSPPPVNGGVDLFFTAANGGRAAVDLREALGAQAKWTAIVECGTNDTDVELSWPDVGLLPADIRPILKDLATGRSVYMRTAKAYLYRARQAGAKRRFEITVAGPDYRPIAVQLAAAPNNGGGAEITYTLNRAAKVQIEVRNIAGRLVATVAAQAEGKAGLNRAVWSGMAANGTRVPTGTYIIELSAVADDNGETARCLRPLRLTR